MTTTSESNFLDGNGARILAGILAIIIAILWFYNYKGDFDRLMAGNETIVLPEASSEVSEATNPQLASCFARRIGDVDKMKEDGILSDQQYAAFRTRAEELCLQQNPS